MPTSKKRKPTSARSIKRDPRAALPPANLQSATLALTQASLEIVREAELEIQAAVRSGEREKIDAALEVHHLLRSASLGLLTAYSQLSGLPDPRESAVLAS